MKNQIRLIRKEIDDVDNQLMELIKQRMNLVREIGRIKARYRLPIKDPEREEELIARDRALAENKNISADLIEDIFRRLFQESYIEELNPDIDNLTSNMFFP